MCVRLLAQLDETENAFEQFWCKHHLKLEQCLQLRHFEQDFREVYLSICLSVCLSISLSASGLKPLDLLYQSVSSQLHMTEYLTLKNIPDEHFISLTMVPFHIIFNGVFLKLSVRSHVIRGLLH